MSNFSNDHGRGYEYICLHTLRDEIAKLRPVEIVFNSSYTAAERSWNTLDHETQVLYKISSESTIQTLFSLEPNIVEKDDQALKLFIQQDGKGIEGDVRDIIIERENIRWEIGLSIKHNHAAVKHSRLSGVNDFGEKWYGVKCSSQYWEEITPIFGFLREEKKKRTRFEDIPSKAERVYVPILNAFKSEVERQVKADQTIPKKLVEYLLSKYDFYKVISIDIKRVTVIQSFNMYGTLNLPSKTEKPTITIPLISLPTEILHFDFKQDCQTTLLMCMDNGWSFSFRIHNASTIAEPSLKFDVQIIGMPVDVNLKFLCKW